MESSYLADLRFSSCWGLVCAGDVIKHSLLQCSSTSYLYLFVALYKNGSYLLLFIIDFSDGIYAAHSQWFRNAVSWLLGFGSYDIQLWQCIQFLPFQCIIFYLHSILTIVLYILQIICVLTDVFHTESTVLYEGIFCPVYALGVVRIDPLHFLAGCRTRWLNQVSFVFYILACCNCIVAY